MATCNPMQPVTCLASAAGAGADAVTAAVGDAFAETIREGAQWVIATTVTWWIDVPAIDLEHSPTTAIRGYVQWIALVVAVAGVIWQGVLMAVSRRPDPALTVGRGLFLLALWTAIGLAGPAAALRAGDAFSSWVLDQAADGDAAVRLVNLASLTNVAAPGAVMVLGLLVMLAGLAQAVLMMFREGAVIVLAGLVVLAAAGSMIGATRPWLPRVLGWLLALICYKPAAALVYASALVLVGDSTDVRTFFVGVTMMLLAIAALPALMKLFTWTTGSVGGGGGGLAALGGASAAALHAAASISYHRSTSTRDHTETLRQDLGPDGGGSGPGAGGGPTGGGGGGGSPQMPAPPVAPTGGAGPTSTSSPSTTAGSATSGPGASGGATSGPGASGGATSGASAPSGAMSGAGASGGGTPGAAGGTPGDAASGAGASGGGPSGTVGGAPTGAAASGGTTTSGGTATPGSTASGAASSAAGATSPWLIAAAQLTEAARRAKDATADATTPKDQP